MRTEEKAHLSSLDKMPISQTSYQLSAKIWRYNDYMHEPAPYCRMIAVRITALRCWQPDDSNKWMKLAENVAIKQMEVVPKACWVFFAAHGTDTSHRGCMPAEKIAVLWIRSCWNEIFCQELLFSNYFCTIQVLLITGPTYFMQHSS